VGDTSATFSTLTASEDIPSDVLRDVKRIRFDGYLPDSVVRAVDEHDCVIACEGSMFKSNFSSALSALMATAIGRAVRTAKPAFAYGAEVAGMDSGLEKFVKDAVGNAPIFCRSEASLRNASNIGLTALPGADTAWTFQATQADRSRQLMSESGWDGHSPIVTICPANPFWWPVRANPQMAMEMQRTGEHASLSYGSIFFHADSKEISQKYQRYVEHMARSAAAIASERKAFPVLVAMERMDVTTCEAIANVMESNDGRRPRIIVGYTCRLCDIVGMLRLSTLLISSRFHAIVLSLPGLVPTIGVANDERIRNLLGDSGASERVIDASDTNLCDRILASARRLNPEEASATARLTVRREIRAMGLMGIAFADDIRKLRPDVVLPDRGRHWSNYLPRVSDSLLDILDAKAS
jgi:polysaccharide pyruvyl transferase WcaK-like protein